MENFKPGLQKYSNEAKMAKVEVKPTAIDDKFTAETISERSRIDALLGMSQLEHNVTKVGWLVNIQPTMAFESECPEGSQGIDLYFCQDDGKTFKTTLLYKPYFYVEATPGREPDLAEYLKKKYQKQIASTEIVEKEDLQMMNHLNGNRQKFIKVSFFNTDQLRLVKQYLVQVINRNKERDQSTPVFNSIFQVEGSGVNFLKQEVTTDYVRGIKEHDLMYYTRVTIDQDIRVGLWYEIQVVQGQVMINPREDLVTRADPVVLAYDIETTKLPLRFPDSSFDCIMMISYMIDGQGYLITNREIISQDIDDFEYTPKPEYKGEFQIFNEPTEKALLKRFFNHIVLAKPNIFVTYNGDFFDWPFVEARAKANGLDMYKEIGVYRNSSGEYLSFYASHMDCFYWVKRDSYLPQGSQNLKAVAKYKLGYDPVELDPEEMTRYAAELPQSLAEYSVSDAVATYYLYMKYVHPFTFSLCNIIPLNPDDVLRRGSGTLCEHLLMVQSHKANVIMPNKHIDGGTKFFDGHMLNSETYVGGHVEALEAGVFRSDLPTKFKLSPPAFQQLIDEIDLALKFSIQKEGNLDLNDILNYDDIRDQIVKDLEELRDTPNRTEVPLIYHLDVGAMYPNIILTNRLQPDSIVDESTCASCDFNMGPDSSCQRRLTWAWRGEYFLSTKGEYNMLKNQLEQERFPGRTPKDPLRAFHELSLTDQDLMVKKRMSDYTRKVYGKNFNQKVVEKTSIVCQRENPFYVNTVRNFRDRRYEYKALLKQWKKKLEGAQNSGEVALVEEASKMVVLFDSLQTAHKCILNSFYGYVMRKGARWYSMEMAGIVCLTGAKIIQLARERVEQIGRPLELDTDGIWCMLPGSFPENFTFNLKNGKTYHISYPCVMLNHLVHDMFTNHQYQDLIDPETKEYSVRSENSIFFEVDGPYRAMILPASTEADKLLKKRYAVFNHDGTLAELKGFEVKRRGELKLIKNFQSSIFKVFLEGNTLDDCYKSVAAVCNRWVDILHTKGKDLGDAELFDLLSENRSMSKALEDYGAQKSTSITCAKRLAEFLGAHMVKDRGLNCKFIISEKPLGAPVSERAVPLAIFQAEETQRRRYLRKWLKDGSIQYEDIRALIDWEYYTERFGSVIQKLVTIPAACQDVQNPVPRIKHPDWLLRRLASANPKERQMKITELFKIIPKSEQIQDLEDLEDMENVDPAENEEPQVIVQKPAKVVIPERLPNGKRRVKTPLVLPKTWKRNKSMIRDRTTPDENPFNHRTHYISWLKAQKPIWAQKLKAKKTNLNRKALANEGISKYFDLTSAGVGDCTWELLQISETDSPGIFRIWAIINGKLESIDIEIPRIFFVNCKSIDESNIKSWSGVKVIKRVRTLPRGHPCLNLFELEMTELFYRQSASIFSTMFNHRDVEGVYETQVPLLLRALISLGRFATLDIPVEEFDRTKPLNLTSIANGKKNDVKEYMESKSFAVCYVYHASANNNQFVGIFVPSLGKFHFFILNPFNTDDNIGSIKKVYSDGLEEYLNGREEGIDSFLEYPAEISTNQRSFKTERDFYAAMNEVLLNLHDTARGPTVILLQSAHSSKFYRNSGVVAFREFPFLTVPNHKADNDFPALGWQRYSATRMITHAFNLSEFIVERIELARYADVPVCNIENDFTLFLSDLFLARKLKQTDCVLWYTPSTKPDLGGREKDENISFLQEFKCPEINISGTYDTVCIEMDLWDLSLSTLIRSVDNSDNLDASAQLNSRGNVHLINNHLSINGKNAIINRTKFIDVETPQHALYTIRSMIKGWVSQVRSGNKFACNLMEHLHRWITSQSSLAYDSLIVTYTLNMMKKVFAMLLDEFRRLGSKIVYANFEKIVVTTTKTELRTGTGYIQYVLAAISRNPLFEHIELKPTAIWDYLVWYDRFNYGGLYFKNGFEDIEDNEAIVDMRWNIAEYLPAPIQSLVLRLCAEYFYVVQKLKSNNQPEALGVFISTDFKRKLMQAINDIQHHRPLVDGQEEITNYVFPKLPGLVVEMNNPVLEFIKTITLVLSLDSRFENEQRLLKKDLLRLIDVGEFSATAVSKNPCEKYLLNQVVCEYCNFCCDLDITRKHATDSAFLACEGCGMVYDKEEIELLLIRDVETLLCRWQLQDLRCGKCRELSLKSFSDRCRNCTVELEPVLNRKFFKSQLSTLKNIGEFYSMPGLLELTAFVLR